jgi:hypothetical protein
MLSKGLGSYVADGRKVKQNMAMPFLIWHNEYSLLPHVSCSRKSEHHGAMIFNSKSVTAFQRRFDSKKGRVV